MIPFDEIDSRLDGIRKDRDWLASETLYSTAYVRDILAPNSTRRTERIMKTFSDAIEKEEAHQAAEKAKEIDEAAAKREAELKALREGPALVLRPKEEQFHKWETAALDQRKTLSDWAAWAIDEFIRMEAGKPSSAPSNVTHYRPAAPSAREKLVALPFFGLVAAGQPGGPIDVPEGEFDVAGDYDPASHYVLRVNGDSMLPDYPHKTLLLCRKLRDGEFAKKGDDVIACDASGCYFKRLEYRKTGPKGDTPRKARPHLVSLNPDFDEVIPVADSPIVAVVVKKL